jgi:hypothetical protein
MFKLNWPLSPPVRLEVDTANRRPTSKETISDAPDENKAENRGLSPDPHTIDACTEGMSTIEASSGKVIV